MERDEREGWIRYLEARSHYILLAEHEHHYPALSPDLRAVLAFVRRKAAASLREVNDIQQYVLDSRGALDARDARDARDALEARVRSLLGMHENLELLIRRLLKDNPLRPFSPEVRSQILGVVDDPHVRDIVRAMTRNEARVGLRVVAAAGRALHGHRVRKQTRRDLQPNREHPGE